MSRVLAYTRYFSEKKYGATQLRVLKLAKQNSPSMHDSPLIQFNEAMTSCYTPLHKRPAWMELEKAIQPNDIITAMHMDVISVDVEEMAGLIKRFAKARSCKVMLPADFWHPYDLGLKTNLAVIEVAQTYRLGAQFIEQGHSITHVQALTRLPKDALVDIQSRCSTVRHNL